MRDSGYTISGDLKRAMQQEAREEQQAEAEAAWYDAVGEVEDSDELREMRRDLAEERTDIDREIEELRRQINALESDRDTVESRKRFVERRIREVDPVIVVEIAAHETRRRGWTTGVTVEKAPPMPDRTNDDDGPAIMNHPVSETVADTIEWFTGYINPAEHDSGDTVVTLHFDDMEDDRPTTEWCDEA